MNKSSNVQKININCINARYPSREVPNYISVEITTLTQNNRHRNGSFAFQSGLRAQILFKRSPAFIPGPCVVILINRDLARFQQVTS